MSGNDDRWTDADHTTEVERPRIDVTHQDLVVQTRLAWQAIQQENRATPFLFRRGSIVRIEHSELGAVIVREVTPDRLRHAIAPLADWYKPATKWRGEGPALP